MFPRSEHSKAGTVAKMQGDFVIANHEADAKGRLEGGDEGVHRCRDGYV
jgi:hypothetical protein